ncbi:MAG: hypothetical protein U0892_10625 [Pirellulales bacterium]
MSTTAEKPLRSALTLANRSKRVSAESNIFGSISRSLPVSVLSHVLTMIILVTIGIISEQSSTEKWLATFGVVTSSLSVLSSWLLTRNLFSFYCHERVKRLEVEEELNDQAHRCASDSDIY